MAAELFIKNGVVRSAPTAKRASKLKIQGYTEFKPGKAKPAPAPKAKTE